MKHIVLPHHTYLTEGSWGQYMSSLIAFTNMNGCSNPMNRRGQDLLKILRIQL